MKRTLINASLLGLLLTLSQVTQAHAGHDHTHWSSQPLHFFTVAVITAIVVSRLIYRKVISQHRKNSTAGE
jgi:hypothetical protein